MSERTPCPKCGATESISIDIHVESDEPLAFFSCRRCEGRWWEKDGKRVSLEEVLALTARRYER